MKHHIQINAVAGLPGRQGDAARVEGTTLVVGERRYDFAKLMIGQEIAPGFPVLGVVTRDADGLHYELVMCYATVDAAPNQPSDPEHWRVVVEDADVPDLVQRLPAEGASET